MTQAAILDDKPAEGTGTYKNYVTFLVDDRVYAVDIQLVREIKQWSPTTVLPNQPHYTRGVLNLRGTIVPVHDLRARFGGELTDTTENNVIVIVNIGEQTVGVLVDAVSDIVTVSTDEIRPVPATVSDYEATTISGLVNTEAHMVALIDLPALFPAQANMAG
ncbi:MAG: chemotaxis protein CheW [Pseudomonadota bacterium]